MSYEQIEAEINNIIEESINSSHQYIPNMAQNDTTPQNETLAQQQSTIDEQSIEIFNNALHQYLRIDEEIKTLMQAIKIRNEIKKNLGETLSNYLKTNEIKTVNLDGSYKGKKLEAVVSQKATGFNKATVTEAIYNELKEDAEVFDKIMQALSRTSVMKEVWRLKVVEEKTTRGSTLTKPRGKKNNHLEEANNLLIDE